MRRVGHIDANEGFLKGVPRGVYNQTLYQSSHFQAQDSHSQGTSLWTYPRVLPTQGAVLPHGRLSQQFQSAPTSYEGPPIPNQSAPLPGNNTPLPFQGATSQLLSTSYSSTPPSHQRSFAHDTSLFESIQSYCDEVSLDDIQLDGVTFDAILSESDHTDRSFTDRVPSFDLSSKNCLYEGAHLETVPTCIVSGKDCIYNSAPRKRVATETVPSDALLYEAVPSKGVVSETIRCKGLVYKTAPSETSPCKRVAYETVPCEVLLHGPQSVKGVTTEIVPCKENVYEPLPCESVASKPDPFNGPASEIVYNKSLASTTEHFKGIATKEGHDKGVEFDTFHRKGTAAESDSSNHKGSGFNPFEALAYETVVNKCLLDIVPKNTLPEIVPFKEINDETLVSVDLQEMQKGSGKRGHFENCPENHDPVSSATTDTGQREASSLQPVLSAPGNSRPNSLTKSLGASECKVTKIHYENPSENNQKSENHITQRRDETDQQRLEVRVCDLVDHVIENTISEYEKS